MKNPKAPRRRLLRALVGAPPETPGRNGRQPEVEAISEVPPVPLYVPWWQIQAAFNDIALRRIDHASRPDFWQAHYEPGSERDDLPGRELQPHEPIAAAVVIRISIPAAFVQKEDADVS